MLTFPASFHYHTPARIPEIFLERFIHPPLPFRLSASDGRGHCRAWIKLHAWWRWYDWSFGPRRTPLRAIILVLDDRSGALAAGGGLYTHRDSFRQPPFPKPWHALSSRRLWCGGYACYIVIYIEVSHQNTAASKLLSLPHGLQLVSVRALLNRREPSNKPVPESRPGGLYPLSSMLTQGRRA